MDFPLFCAYRQLEAYSRAGRLAVVSTDLTTTVTVDLAPK